MESPPSLASHLKAQRLLVVTYMVVVIGSGSLQVVVVSQYQIWSCRISDVPSGKSVRVYAEPILNSAPGNLRQPAISRA